MALLGRALPLASFQVHFLNVLQPVVALLLFFIPLIFFTRQKRLSQLISPLSLAVRFPAGD